MYEVPMLWVGSGSLCGLWSFSLLEAHCFSASALWAWFRFERPRPASPLLWQLQLSLFLTENFKQYDILAPLMSLSFDLPWMEYNPNHLVQLSKELFPGDGG